MFNGGSEETLSGSVVQAFGRSAHKALHRVIYVSQIENSKKSGSLKFAVELVPTGSRVFPQGGQDRHENQN